MNTYIAVLNIQCGEYQKDTTHILQAEDEHTAGRKALLAESHGEPVWHGNAVHDLHGEFIYTIQAVREVAPDDVETVRKYIGWRAE